LYAAVQYRIRSHHRDDAHEKLARPLPFASPLKVNV
jgi:hypothetical protein